MPITKRKGKIPAHKKRAQKLRLEKRNEIELEVFARLIDQHATKLESYDKDGSKSIGHLIRTRSAALEHSIKDLVLNQTIRAEIAFAVAELSPELEEMLLLVDRSKHGDFSREDLMALLTMASHWPQHLRDLKRNLLRAFEET